MSAIELNKPAATTYWFVYKKLTDADRPNELWLTARAGNTYSEVTDEFDAPLHSRRLCVYRARHGFDFGRAAAVVRQEQQAERRPVRFSIGIAQRHEAEIRAEEWE